jgi:hypothetical protein
MQVKLLLLTEGTDERACSVKAKDLAKAICAKYGSVYNNIVNSSITFSKMVKTTAKGKLVVEYILLVEISDSEKELLGGLAELESVCSLTRESSVLVGWQMFVSKRNWLTAGNKAINDAIDSALEEAKSIALRFNSENAPVHIIEVKDTKSIRVFDYVDLSALDRVRRANMFNDMENSVKTRLQILKEVQIHVDI